jgi:ribonuclease HII
VVGAVVLGEARIDGLTDSKRLTYARRVRIAEEIRANAAGYGLGWVHAAEIDEIGLSASLTLATQRALEQLRVSYRKIVIDGTINFLRDTGEGRFVTTLPKADLLVPEVSAASVVAKVARDLYMAELAQQYPAYGFESHVGYGTVAHRAALEAHGVTDAHRRSFAPIAALLAGPRSTDARVEPV